MATFSVPFGLELSDSVEFNHVKLDFESLIDTLNTYNAGTVGWDAVSIGTASTTTGVLKFFNSTNANTVSFQPAVTSASATYTWPLAAPAGNNYVLGSSTAGIMSWINAPGTYAPIGSAFVTIGTDATLTNERALTGTSNQVVVTDNGAGSTVVLSTPQNIDAGATPTFASEALTATTNQLILGTTRTYTITAPTPATSSRTLTIPDPGTNASFVLTESAQTINGKLTLTNSTFDWINSHTSSIAIASQTLGKTYTIPDVQANANFIMSAGSPAFTVALAMGSNKITGLSNGTASSDAAAFGQLKVIQTVSTTNATPFTTTSSTFQTTNLSLAITPTSASNKILVLISGSLRSARLDLSGAYASLFRGATNLGNTSGIGITLGPVSGTVIQNLNISCSMHILDAPATTSATTYSVKIANQDNSTTVAWGNESTTTIVLMEVV